MTDLTGRAALVTGSTHGIGRATAAQLLAAGMNVVVNSRDEGRAREAAEGLARWGPGRAVGIAADVRDPSACAALVEGAVRAFGRLDVLDNNAGVGILKPVQELSAEDWAAQIETNLGGVFHCSRAAVPHLKKSGDGWIINIGSLAGRNAFAGGAAYNATKFGVLGMSEAMMLDLRYENIRVSVVMPGSVDTDFGGGHGGSKKGWALEAEDVARAVLQLVQLPPHALVSRVEMRPSRPPK
jgi:NAD(P)-dependent dehydrogenase (short-subunit alcohol dehydrogenase family)